MSQESSSTSKNTKELDYDSQRDKISGKVLFIFCLSGFCSGLGTMAIPLFLPLVAIQKDITQYYIGLILGVRAISGCLSPPVVRYMMEKISSETISFWATVVQSASFFILAGSCFFQNSSAFIALCIISQLLIGAAYSGIQICMNSLLLRYSAIDKREKNLGLFRLYNGLGSMIGPLIGALCYFIGGYTTVFATLFLCFAILSPFMYYQLTSAYEAWQLLKKDLPKNPDQNETISELLEPEDGSQDEENVNAQDDQKSKTEKISLWELCKVKYFVFPLITGAIANSLFSYSMAIFTPLMDEVYGIGPSQASLITLCCTPSFVLGAKLAYILTSRKMMKRRNVIYMSMILAGLSQIICTGEIYLITEKPQLWIVGTCMFFMGGSVALLFVMTFPEMVEASEVHLISKDQKYDTEDLNATMSSAYVLSCQIAMGVAPFLSNCFAGLYTYNISLKIAGVTVLFFTLLYLGAIGFSPQPGSENLDLQEQDADEEMYDKQSIKTNKQGTARSLKDQDASISYIFALGSDIGLHSQRSNLLSANQNLSKRTKNESKQASQRPRTTQDSKKTL